MLRFKRQAAWFAAFTAIFAAMAAYVFWGAWSPDVTPVMPDAPIVHPAGYWNAASRTLREFCLANAQFIPDDLVFLVGTPYFRQELFYAICAFFSALGMVYYCRGRGLSRLASYSAGLFLAFSGYWFTLYAAGHGSWFRLMTYCVFAFGLADRAVRKNKLKNWLLLGATVAWGCRWQPDIWLIFALLSGAYFIWCCVRERKFPGIGRIVAAAAVFFVVAAPFIRTAFKDALSGRENQIAESKGTSLSGGGGKSDDEARWIFVTNWSLPPDEAVEFFSPRVNGDTSCPLSLAIAREKRLDLKPYTGALGRPYGAREGNYRQHSLYVGRATCIFALFAFVAYLFALRRKATPDGESRAMRSDVPFFAAAAVCCFLFSLGRYCEPVYRIVYALPFGDTLRAPVKWHHATEFCIVALAAHGIDAAKVLLCSLLSRWTVPVLACVALLGAADLASKDSVYCAPVDVSDAKRLDCAMDLTFVHESQLRSPQFAGMVKAGMLKPIGRYPGRRDVRLVKYLHPRGAYEPPPAASGWVLAMGVASLLTTLGVCVYGVKKS